MNAACSLPGSEPGSLSADAYRDDAGAAGWRLAQRRAARADLDARTTAVQALYARRCARASAGAAATLAGLASFAAALLSAIDGWRFFQPAEDGLATWLLVGGWPLAAVAWGLGHIAGAVHAGWTVRRAARSTGDAHLDLARLEAGAGPLETILRMARRLEVAGIALPLVGLTFLTPLTLHLFVAPLFDAWSARQFAGWIRMSAALVGHAHLVLAALSIHHARQLRAADPVRSLQVGTWKTYGLTVGASAVPGVVFLALPPLIVAATGLVFIPAMFGWARRCSERERALASTEAREDGPGRAAASAPAR